MGSVKTIGAAAAAMFLVAAVSARAGDIGPTISGGLASIYSSVSAGDGPDAVAAAPDGGPPAGVPPVTGEAPPAAGDVPPVSGQVPPAAGDVPPVASTGPGSPAQVFEQTTSALSESLAGAGEVLTNPGADPGTFAPLGAAPTVETPAALDALAQQAAASLGASAVPVLDDSLPVFSTQVRRQGDQVTITPTLPEGADTGALPPPITLPAELFDAIPPGEQLVFGGPTAGPPVTDGASLAADLAAALPAPLPPQEAPALGELLSLPPEVLSGSTDLIPTLDLASVAGVQDVINSAPFTGLTQADPALTAVLNDAARTVLDDPGAWASVFNDSSFGDASGSRNALSSDPGTLLASGFSGIQSDIGDGLVPSSSGLRSSPNEVLIASAGLSDMGGYLPPMTVANASGPLTGSAADLQGVEARGIDDFVVPRLGPLELPGRPDPRPASPVQIRPGDSITVDPGGGQGPLEVFPNPSATVNFTDWLNLGISQTDVPTFSGATYQLENGSLIRLPPSVDIDNAIRLTPGVRVPLGEGVGLGGNLTFNTQTGQVDSANVGIGTEGFSVTQGFGRPGAVASMTLPPDQLRRGLDDGSINRGNINEVLDGAVYGTERGPLQPSTTTFSSTIGDVPVSAAFTTDGFQISRVTVGDGDNPAAATGSIGFDATGSVNDLSGRVPIQFSDDVNAQISGGVNPQTGDFRAGVNVNIGERLTPAQEAARQEAFAAEVPDRVTQAVNELRAPGQSVGFADIDLSVSAPGDSVFTTANPDSFSFGDVQLQPIAPAPVPEPVAPAPVPAPVPAPEPASVPAPVAVPVPEPVVPAPAPPQEQLNISLTEPAFPIPDPAPYSVTGWDLNGVQHTISTADTFTFDSGLRFDTTPTFFGSSLDLSGPLEFGTTNLGTNFDFGSSSFDLGSSSLGSLSFGGGFGF